MAHSYTEELEDEDSLELVEDDDELELDDLDENLALLDDDSLARLCVGCKNTIAKAKRIAGRVKAKIR